MTSPQPEPSMEEILASIRRIISEDDEDVAQADDAMAEATPAVDVTQTTQPTEALSPAADERPTYSEGAIDAAHESDAVEEALAQLRPVSLQDEVENFDVDASAGGYETTDTTGEELNQMSLTATVADDIVDETSATVASEAFRSLSQSIRISGEGEKTLEDVVTSLLRPLIKEWLDQNLPAIVEEKVQDEVQRIARRAR